LLKPHFSHVFQTWQENIAHAYKSHDIARSADAQDIVRNGCYLVVCSSDVALLVCIIVS